MTNPPAATSSSAAPPPAAPIRPTQARFIRLGPASGWARRCFDTATLRFGDQSEPHDLCLAGDWDGVADALRAAGRPATEVGNTLRECRDFHTADPHGLWITFAAGQMWWTFATPEPTYRLPEGEPGVVARRTTGWRNTTLAGEPLGTERLSSALTKTAGDRRTICQVADRDALCRIINGEEQPAATRARAAEAALAEAAEALVRRLHQTDFERFADLLLARLGWRRVSELGGRQADVDLIVEQPATGERAFVQCKSSADGGVLADTVARFAAGPCDRLFFLCHSPAGALAAASDKPVHLWAGPTLARQAVAAGLVGWLIDSTR